MLEAIAAHARRDSPQECCGLLIGTDAEVLEAVPTANIAAEPRRRYEVDPREHLAQIRRCRELKATEGLPLSVVGVYHSHPRSEPVPSPTDLDQAFEEFLYVIAGPVESPGGLRIAGYRMLSGGFQLVELTEGTEETGSHGGTE